MNAIEQNELSQCEEIIETGLHTFVEVGTALLTIRDKRLYRDDFSTFEKYCQERWGMARNYANKMIAASMVVANLGTNVPIPTNEAQARPLSSIPASEQAQVWQLAVDTAPMQLVTAAHVREVVESMKTCPDCGKMWMADLPFCPYCNLSATARIEGLKKAPHVSNNGGVNEWYTPPEYIACARAVMGRIDLDPASSEIANKIVGATLFYSWEDDGLSKFWAGKVWMNPPYSIELIRQFVTKYVEHVSNGDISEGIVLVNNATETNWFNDLISVSSAVVFPNGRVRFLDPEGNPGAPLQGQAVIYTGKNPDKFMAEFGEFGWSAKL